MWSQAVRKWISRSSRDREWVLNGDSEDSESEDGGFADGDCRYQSSRFGFGRPSTVPCRGAVNTFLRTRILTWNGFLHSMHGRDVCVPQCTSQPLEGFNWQQARIPYLDSAGSESGSQTCTQSAMGMGSIWIPHLRSTGTGNWQPATSMHPISIHPACIPQIPVRPTNRRAFRNGSSA